MKKSNFKKNYAVTLSLLLVFVMLFSNAAHLPSAIFSEATDDGEKIKNGAVIGNQAWRIRKALSNEQKYALG